MFVCFFIRFCYSPNVVLIPSHFITFLIVLEFYYVVNIFSSLTCHFIAWTPSCEVCTHLAIKKFNLVELEVLLQYSEYSDASTYHGLDYSNTKHRSIFIEILFSISFLFVLRCFSVPFRLHW
jgi:hypothetical protein